MACAAPAAMVMSRVELLLRAMSGAIVLLQLESVMMPMACVGTEVHRNHVR